MLVNGDKLVVTKKVASFLNVGDIVKVVDVNDDIISFAFGDGFVHMGMMNEDECKAHFEKIEEKASAPTITQEHIDNIMVNSEIKIETVFDKCTIVSCKLPNGFVIVESSACVSPENYNEDMGIEICLDKITNKIWELEGYRLQNELYEKNDCAGDDCDNCCCDECPCVESYDDEEDECDECLDTDLDCDECKDYDCPYNPNSYPYIKH